MHAVMYIFRACTRKGLDCFFLFSIGFEDRSFGDRYADHTCVYPATNFLSRCRLYEDVAF